MTQQNTPFPSATDPPLLHRSWHDNSVHALALSEFNSDEGTATLTLDIDHILEWILPTGGKFYEFQVAPALLRFYGVFGLKMSVDYSIGPIGMTPFQIDKIERSEVATQYGKLLRWRIVIACPTGEIIFDAHDWSLTFTGAAVKSGSQSLSRPLARMDV